MGIQAGIVGYSGYSGAELLGILSRHPSAEAVLLDHRDDASAALRIARDLQDVPFAFGVYVVSRRDLYEPAANGLGQHRS